VLNPTDTVTILGVGTFFNYTSTPNFGGVFPGSGTATFGATNGSNISFSAFTTNVGGWTFTPEASNYTFLVPGGGPSLNFAGAGIIVNGGSVTITNGSFLTFHGTSTAGSATINNLNGLMFFDNSSAGNATINNNG